MVAARPAVMPGMIFPFAPGFSWRRGTEKIQVFMKARVNRGPGMIGIEKHLAVV